MLLGASIPFRIFGVGFVAFLIFIVGPGSLLLLHHDCDMPG